jgi:hypothetical protein
VLSTHSHHVTAALSRVQQQLERQSCLRSDRVARAVLFDVLRRPNLETLRTNLDCLDAKRWIVVPHAELDRKPHQHAYHPQPIVCGCGRLYPVAEHLSQLVSLKMSDLALTVLFAKSLNNASVGCPCARR